MDDMPVAGSSDRNSPEFLQLSVALAMEIVSGMSSPNEVFARHGFSKTEAAKMLKNPAFQQMLREAKANWEANSNAEERIRLKAKLALEELLVPHFLLAKSPDTPGPVRNEAVKTFERLSGMMQERGNSSAIAPGERFVVNINLGDASERITIDAPMLKEHENA